MKKYRVPVRFTGQHFTIDTLLINDAIRLANVQKEDLVLDIGAGRGFLTVHIVKKSDHVIAIENDSRLVSELRSTFKFSKKVSIVGVDFRRFSVPEKHFKVVSNIPYGITSEILKSLMFTYVAYFTCGCLVMQLEAAQKLVKQKFSNPYVVFYQTFFELELRYEISPNSFQPPPTVKSALVKITKKNRGNLGADRKEQFLAFLFFMFKSRELPIRTALRRIFRKQQVRELSEKYGMKLDQPVCLMTPQQLSACFVEMEQVVPDKFHPSYS